jgi:hypothetical protein
MNPGDNLRDPAFWASMGITPIIIDESTPENFEASMAQIDAAFENAVAELIDLLAENE